MKSERTRPLILLTAMLSLPLMSAGCAQLVAVERQLPDADDVCPEYQSSVPDPAPRKSKLVQLAEERGGRKDAEQAAADCRTNYQGVVRSYGAPR